MERKIGEIFEFGGKWYQCLKSASCDECAFLNSNCIDNPSLKCSVDDRTDNCTVIFKKLEKWGGPYPNADKLYQLYRLPMNIEKLPPHTEGINLVRFDIVEIEIKQNKEDMEEYRMHDAKEDIPEFDKVVDECLFGEDKLNLKPFDLEAAKAGKPVCTRDGHKARIICFDGKGDQPIIALVEAKGNKDALIEKVERYFINGHSVFEVRETNNDLMMLPEKKEGWVNVYKERCYETKEEAIKNKYDGLTYIDTVKILCEE